MAVFVAGILLWLLGVILLFWSKSKKYDRKKQSGYDSYPKYLFRRALEFVLWGAGILGIFLGSIMILIQNYSSSPILLTIFIPLVFWMAWELKVR